MFTISWPLCPAKLVPSADFTAFYFFLLDVLVRSMVAGTGGWQRCRAAFGVYKTIRRNRSTAAAVAMSRLKQQMEKDLLNAAVTAVVMAGTACGGARRTEQRALGKWRGSTLSGYLRNDEKSRKDAFRAFQTTGSTHWSCCCRIQSWPVQAGGNECAAAGPRA